MFRIFASFSAFLGNTIVKHIWFQCVKGVTSSLWYLLWVQTGINKLLRSVE
jgi:hypothetical protein